ncbi:MAG: diadenylate cyclase CdaA [Clostridia bacterium]|nr:diadenylate cyclase CdaA [Clostridia bacterium]
MAEFFGRIFDHIRIVQITDYIDILIVAFVIYHGIKLIKETRASQLIKGIIALVIFAQISGIMRLKSVNYILENTLQLGFIALLIVFQPELRRTLEKVGSSTFNRLIKISDEQPENNNIEEICTAVRKLAYSKTGALILIERQTKLGDVMSSGTVIDSLVSGGLIENIFVPNTPLHDGALIIGEGRIKAAACVLPLTQNNSFSKELGTRHRAAIGISEEADCIAIVVSEETGKISVALNGDITRDYTYATLKKKINEVLESDKPSDNLKKIKAKNIITKAVKKK